MKSTILSVIRFFKNLLPAYIIPTMAIDTSVDTSLDTSLDISTDTSTNTSTDIYL